MNIEKFVIGAGVINIVANADQLTKSISSITNNYKKQVDDIGKKLGDSAVKKASEQALKTAQASLNAINTAKISASKIASGYGLAGDDAITNITDKMITASRIGKISFNEIGSSINKVVPTAKNLKVTNDELFASVGVLASNGMTASEAVGGLEQAFNNILKPNKEAIEMAKQLGLEFNSAHLKSVGFTKFLDEINQKTDGDAEKINKLFTSTKAFNTMSVLAGKDSKEFQKALIQVGNSAGTTDKEMQKLKNSINQTQKEMLDVENVAKRRALNNYTENLKNDMKKVAREVTAKAMVVTGTAIATAVGYGVKQAIDVEKEMSVVKSLAYNTDKAKMNADINGVAQFARNTAISSPFSQIENLQMGQDLLRLGLSGTDINRIGKNMIDTTVAIGEKAPAQVAEAIVSYTKIWDKNTEEANHFGDVITKAMNTTALGFSDYQDAMSYVASTSAKYGMKIEETTALLGSMADKGLKGSSAGTGLSAVMTNTYAANKRSKEALNIMGISAYDNTGKQRNFIDILGEMQKKYAKLNDEQKNQVSLYLAGKEHLKSFDKMMQTNVETIKENIKALEQSNGESERQAKENQKNFAMQSKILKNNIQVLAGEASKTLLPILNDMLQKLIGKLQQLNAWWDKLSDSKKEGIVKTITGLAIGLTTLGGALSISGKVMTLVTTFKTLSTAISGVGGALKIIPLLTNPVGLAITGIGLAAFLVIKFWKPISDFFKKLWGGVKSVTKTHIPEILTVIMPFVGLPLLIIKNWDKIKGSFSNIFGHIKTGAKNLVNTVATDFKNASWGEKLVWTLNPFAYLVEKVIKKNIKATKEAWESFVGTVENLKEKVIAPFRAIAEWIQRILEKWNNFKNSFSLPQINIPFVGNVGGGNSKESSKTTNVTINNKNNISNNYDYNKFNTQTQRDIRRGLFAW